MRAINPTSQKKAHSRARGKVRLGCVEAVFT
jgi:hypothetical protein